MTAYNVETIKKALGKRRMSKIKEFAAYNIGSFTTDGMCFDIMMKDGWFYDGDQTVIVFEATTYEYTQTQVIKVLKNEIDRFEFDFFRGVLEAYEAQS